MNIYKVLPSLKRTRQLKLWHKALRAQWSAEDMRWELPLGVRADRLKDALAKVLTPVLMGEQSALYSVSHQIPLMGHRSEVEGQFYLTTWAVDEARHTELFARFYDRLGREPLPIRRFPAGYLFQSQITADEPAEWLSGVLVSEVLAKHVMEEFVRLDLDPVLSEISDGILEDEARHLGFNHLYLEDRFAEVYRKDRAEGDENAERLQGRLQRVLDHLPPMVEALAPELAEMGIDKDAIVQSVASEARQRLELSIERGSNVGTGERTESHGASAGAAR